MQQEHTPVVVHECTLTVYHVVLGSEGGAVVVVIDVDGEQTLCALLLRNRCTLLLCNRSAHLLWFKNALLLCRR